MTETKETKTDPKSLWKDQVLDYLHSCLVGISHLECTNQECPLVDNWNELETKLSRKGKAVLYKITTDNWMAADLKEYETNDLGTYENIEIEFKSGKIQRTKPKDPQPITRPIKESGYTPKNKEAIEEIYLKPDEIILFFNNHAKKANLKNIEDIYLNDLWTIKEQIAWDREKSKKKVLLFTENEPSDQTQAEKISASEKDYLFYISDPSITNSIKNYEVFQTQNTKEREQLHADYKEGFSEMRRVYGIRHLTSKKEDRQNNPEIELNEAQFIALERDKKRERLKSIKDFESKGGCLGKHVLTYGTAPEQRKEKVQELEEIKDLEAENKKEASKGEPPKHG